MPPPTGRSWQRSWRHAAPIEEKKERIQQEKKPYTASLGKYQPAVDKALENIRKNKVIEKKMSVILQIREALQYWDEDFEENDE